MTFSITDAVEKLALAVAAAAAIGGGSMLLAHNTQVAVITVRQDEYARQMQRVEAKLDDIIDRLPPKNGGAK